MASFWTDERREHAIKLWLEGKSSNACAKIIGCSRNAVVGIIHRADIDPVRRSSSTRSQRSLSPRNAPPPTKRTPPAPPKAAGQSTRGLWAWTPPRLVTNHPTPVVVLADPQRDRSRLRITDLRFGECKWPLGEAMARARFFCGEPSATGSSYCAEHRARAHW